MRNLAEIFSEFAVVECVHRATCWTHARPHLVVSAWLRSGFVVRAAYVAQGLEPLLAQAELRSKDADSTRRSAGWFAPGGIELRTYIFKKMDHMEDISLNMCS